MFYALVVGFFFFIKVNSSVNDASGVIKQNALPLAAMFK